MVFDFLFEWCPKFIKLTLIKAALNQFDGDNFFVDKLPYPVQLDLKLGFG